MEDPSMNAGVRLPFAYCFSPLVAKPATKVHYAVWKP